MGQRFAFFILGRDNDKKAMITRAHIPPLNDDVISVIVSYIDHNVRCTRWQASTNGSPHSNVYKITSVMDVTDLHRAAQISTSFWRHTKMRRQRVIEQDQRNMGLYEMVQEWCKDKIAAEKKYGHIKVRSREE